MKTKIGTYPKSKKEYIAKNKYSKKLKHSKTKTTKPGRGGYKL